MSEQQLPLDPEMKTARDRVKNAAKECTSPKPPGTLDLVALLRPKKSIQVAAAGTILITELERRIIDTPDFQRLRRIKQLGAAYLIYPTAVHTRFDHSLGTLQIASEMIRCIRDNLHSEEGERDITREQELIIRLYALLHDITHVPFGHTIEDELGLLKRHDENEERIDHFLGPKSEIGKILKEEMQENLYKILMQVVRHDPDAARHDLDPSWHFVHELVSNTVCADLLDYLRRDDRFCDLGISMRYRFLNFLYLSNPSESKSPRHVVIRLYKGGNMPRRDTLSDLCRLLESRYMIAERVYFHHAKLAAGAMFGVAVQGHAAMIGDKDRPLEEVIRSVGDEEFISILATSKSLAARTVASSFRNRALYKELDTITLDEFNSAVGRQGEKGRNLNELIENWVKNPAIRAAAIAKYASLVGCTTEKIAVYVPPRKMGLKEAKMKVVWDGKVMELEEVDDEHVQPRLKAVKEAHMRLWAIKLIVAPELRPDPPGTHERDAEKDRRADWLKRMVRAEFLAATDDEYEQALKGVRSEVAARIAIQEMPELIENPIPPAHLETLHEAMAQAGASLYKDGGDIRAAMLKAGRGFLASLDR